MKKQRGSAFILSLMLTVIMLMVIGVYGQRLRTHMRTETLRLEQRQAKNAAYAGLARALVELNEVEPSVLSDQDTWWALGEDTQSVFQLSNSSFRLEIVDAGAYLNLNTVDQPTLERLGVLIEDIEALLDWREESLQPRVQGAKDEYYNALPEPYNTKLLPFDSMNEVFLVRGWTPTILEVVNQNSTASPLTAGTVENQPPLRELFTVDSLAPNTRPDGTAKVDVNNSSTGQLIQAGLRQEAAQAIVQQRNSQGTFETLGDVFEAQGLEQQDFEVILENLTTTTDVEIPGQININTCQEYVLNAIPNMDSDVVQSILGRQGTFESIGELATLPGVNAEVLQTIAGKFTVGSLCFLVRIVGTAGSATYSLEATVVIEEGQPKVKKIKPHAIDDPVADWGWVEDTVDGETLINQ